MKPVRFIIVLLLLTISTFCYAQGFDDDFGAENGDNVAVAAAKAEEETPTRTMQQFADDQKYENGIYFLKMKKYDKAIQEFQEYLEIYEDGSHRSEAYANLAGIYVGRQHYLRAITMYKSLFEEYSNTEDGIKAFYNMGVCYVKMGYNDSAQNIFKQIQKDYPTSSYAAQAKVQMDLLKILAE